MAIRHNSSLAPGAQRAPNRRAFLALAAGSAAASPIVALAAPHPDAALFALEQQRLAIMDKIDALYDEGRARDERSEALFPYPALVTVRAGDAAIFGDITPAVGGSWRYLVWELRVWADVKRVERAQAIIAAVRDTNAKRFKWCLEHGEAEHEQRLEAADSELGKIERAISATPAATLQGYAVKARAEIGWLQDSEVTPLQRQLAAIR